MKEYTSQDLSQMSRYIRICIPNHLPFTIDLKSHCILNWEAGYEAVTLYEKVVDEGTYSLLDENKKEFYRHQGYVPNSFLPEKDGYGDYLELHINSDGVVTNWYKNPNFSEFVKEGFSTRPSTEK